MLDLAFYALVPFILLTALLPARLGAAETLHTAISWLSHMLANGGPLFIFALLISIIAIRIVGTKVAERIFARSASISYTDNSLELLEGYFAIVNKCRNADASKMRKVINAEISNLHFGFQVPAAFIAAELILLLIIFIYASFLFGAAVFLFVIAVSISIFFILYFIRKKSTEVGMARSAFEQKRLEITEIALNSAFSIGVNGGQKHLVKQFGLLTKNFAYALGQQVVLPYSTKALIDGALVIFVFLLLIMVGVSSSPSDMVLLGGMAVRAIPSLSRISSYVETMRTNAVALTELNTALDSAQLSPAVPRNEELYRALSSLTDNGIFFVIGASGIGKTTTIKQWITEIQTTKSVAFLEQSGFESSAAIDDYLALVGLDVAGAKATQQQLTSMVMGSHRLSHLSGGQAKFLQFFAISRKKVNVYVFDEPSVGLDTQLQAAMIDIMVGLSKSALVVVVSHDQAFVDVLAQRASGTIIEVH